MKEKQSRKFPGTTIAYIFICAGAIFAFIMIGLHPSGKFLARLDMEIAKLQAQIEEQKMLYPFYQELLKKLQTKGPELLPFPSKSRLPRDKIAEVPSILGEIAQKSGLEAVSIAPDVKSIASNHSMLLLTAVLKGDFFDFRKFLMELGKIAYLDHIEQIQIQEILGGRKYSLKIWLALG